MPKVIDLPSSTSMSNSDYFIMEASGGGTKKINRWNALGEDLNNIANGQNVHVLLSVPANRSISINLRDLGYTSAIIMGTINGVGGVIIGLLLNNGTVTARNLMTNAAWTNNAITFTHTPPTTLTISNTTSGAHYISVYAG